MDSKSTKEKEKVDPITDEINKIKLAKSCRLLVDTTRKILSGPSSNHRFDYSAVIEKLRRWLSVNYKEGLRPYSSTADCLSDKIWITICHLMAVDQKESIQIQKASKRFEVALQTSALSVADLIEAIQDRLTHLILTFNHSPRLNIDPQKIRAELEKQRKASSGIKSTNALLDETGKDMKTTANEIDKIKAAQSNALSAASDSILYLYEDQRPQVSSSSSSLAADIIFKEIPLDQLESVCAFVVVEYPLAVLGSGFIPLCCRYFTWVDFHKRLMSYFKLVSIPSSSLLGEHTQRTFLKWCVRQTEVKADFDFTEPYQSFLYMAYLPLGGISNYYRLGNMDLKSTRNHVIFMDNYNELDRTSILCNSVMEVLQHWTQQTITLFRVGIDPRALQHDLHCFFIFCYNFDSYAPGTSFEEEYVLLGEKCYEKQKQLKHQLIRYPCKYGEYRPRVLIFGNDIRVKDGKEMYKCVSRCDAILLWLWLIHHKYEDRLEGGTVNISRLYFEIFKEPLRSSSSSSLLVSSSSSSSVAPVVAEEEKSSSVSRPMEEAEGDEMEPVE